MSPMHHSSASPIQSSTNIHSYISAVTRASHPGIVGGSTRNTLDVHPAGLQRSVSLPLNRERSPLGRQSAMAGVSGERRSAGEKIEELVSGNETVVVLPSSHVKEETDLPAVEQATAGYVYRRRRGALRHNRRAFSSEDENQGPHHSPYLGPRIQSAGATSSAASAAAVARAAALAKHESTRPTLNEEEEEEEQEEEEEEEEEANPLVDSVKHKLLEQGHLSLLDVVEKMPTTLHESIVTDNVSASCLETISNRVPELQSGHLAKGDTDSSRGAIHWFEGESLHDCV